TGIGTRGGRRRARRVRAARAARTARTRRCRRFVLCSASGESPGQEQSETRATWKHLSMVAPLRPRRLHLGWFGPKPPPAVDARAGAPAQGNERDGGENKGEPREVRRFESLAGEPSAEGERDDRVHERVAGRQGGACVFQEVAERGVRN